MKTCPFCSNEIEDDAATICISCGRHLAVEMQSKDEPVVIQKVQPEKQNTKKPGASSDFWVFFIIFVILTALFLGLSSAAQWESVCVTPLFIIYAILVIGFISAFNQQNTAREKADAEAAALRKATEYYNEIKEQVNLPEKVKVITYLKASVKSPIRLANSQNTVYLWKSEDNICFFPCSPAKVNSLIFDRLGVATIPINQIEYFSKQGEVFRETKISGGGGGGSSIGGAVAGGLIAGGTGAVIGSRKKVNEIKSELVTHDTRETFLNYFVNGERHSLFFGVDAHQVFNDLIPDKEFNIVSAIKSSELIRTQIKADETKSITDQIRELAKLQADGIITEQEFSEKKKQLLEKIA